MTAPAMTGAASQLRALLGLRWQMVRAPGGKLGICLGVLFLLYLLTVVAGSADALELAALETAVELAPTAFLGFGVLAVIAPLTAGGGNEVVPPDQLVAYPVRPRTQFLGGLALAPVNLVWVLQLLTLAAMTAYLTVDGSFLLGAVTTASYVGCLTVLGQALAWAVVGLRQTRTGRRIVGSAAAVALVTAVVVVRSGTGDEVLDASPTRTVVAAVAAGDDDLVRWALTTIALVGLTVLCLLLGARTCGWALRRPGDTGAGRATSPVRRRSAKGSALAELVAVDRASVWRAPALRRGGLVLAVLPGLVAAGAGVPWQSLIVLPGLVAAGAGLLFGINAFCLDGSGAVWMASLPHPPHLVARAKALVLTETVFAAALVAALAGSLRSPGSPTSAQLVAIGCSVVCSTAAVVAVAMSTSVRRPHRADLAGPRDAAAPPGALALASVRLALPAGFAGVVLEISSRPGQVWLPIAIAVVVLLLCSLSLRRSLARYDAPFVRARIVQTVSAG